MSKRSRRLKPSDLPGAVNGSGQADVLEFSLTYRAPLDWQALTAFLARRAVAGVEQVENGVYTRTVQFGQGAASHRGWLAVLPSRDEPALRVALSASLSRVVPAVLVRVRRLFDLDCDPEKVARTLGELAASSPGLRLPGAFDGFEAAVRAILGQQITVKAAHTLAGRFASAFGEPVASPQAALRVAFPSPQRVAVLEPPQVAAIGVVGVRAAAIVAIAREITEGRLRLDPAADVETTLNALRRVPGIGEWTTQYLAMRALNWPDAFPASDYGVLKALGEKDPRAALRRAEQWRPWRSYAVMHLWKSLETR